MLLVMSREARSRESLSGEWQVDSARPQEEPWPPCASQHSGGVRKLCAGQVRQIRGPVGFPEALKAFSKLLQVINEHSTIIFQFPNGNKLVSFRALLVT